MRPRERAARAEETADTRAVAEDTAATTSHALVARHADLLDHRGGAVARHYDVAAITASPLARVVFVLPER